MPKIASSSSECRHTILLHFQTRRFYLSMDEHNVWRSFPNKPFLIRLWFSKVHNDRILPHASSPTVHTDTEPTYQCNKHRYHAYMLMESTQIAPLHVNAIDADCPITCRWNQHRLPHYMPMQQTQIVPLYVNAINADCPIICQWNQHRLPHYMSMQSTQIAPLHVNAINADCPLTCQCNKKRILCLQVNTINTDCPITCQCNTNFNSGINGLCRLSVVKDHLMNCVGAKSWHETPSPMTIYSSMFVYAHNTPAWRLDASAEH
jgi:hypothetical protein